MTDAGEKLADRAHQFCEAHGEPCNNGSPGDIHTYAANFARAELERAAGIAEHFAQDELAEEEWPTSGLAEYGQRGDAGVIRRCGENIAAAIRKLKE